MKIIVINSLYSPFIGGGAEIICQDLAEALYKRGLDVVVLTLGNLHETYTDIINGLRVIRIKQSNLYFPKQNVRPPKWKRFLWHIVDVYNPFVNKEVNKILDREKPDLALCHNISGLSVSVWSSLHSHNIPIIEILHDQYLRCPNCNTFKAGKTCEKQCSVCKLMRLPHKRLSNKVEAVVGVSNFVLKCMINNGYFCNSKKYVIHNAQEISETKKSEFWDGNRPLKFGYIGSLVEAKGVRLLISVFISLAINAELYVAGTGSKEFVDELKKIARGCRVFFLGYIKSSSFYEMIDVCVIPSLWPDTFPGVAYESCAHHIPVVASNIGGIPEIIHHGKNGLLFKSGNFESMRESMLYFYSNPSFLQKCSLEARNEVKGMLSPSDVVEKYMSVINDLLV